MIKSKIYMSMLLLFSVLGLVACGGQKDNVELVEQHAAHVHDGQECDLCGMIINQFPGPKGQLFTRGNNQPLAFCSTRDLFAYALQPEHQHRVQSVFVHDVSTAEWGDMSQAKYIDAKQAYFVVGHNQLGAMGPTLAAFADLGAAEQFAKDHGGEIKRFEDIDQSVLNGMNHMAMDHAHAAHH